MSATTARPRWRLAAAASLSTVACGSDVVDDDVQQEVERGVDEAEQEVEDATDGEDGNG